MFFFKLIESLIQIFGITYLKILNWHIDIYTSKEEESAGVQITFSMIFVLFSLCFILIAVLIGFNLARKLSKPIRQFN